MIWLLAMAVGCQEYGYTSNIRTDVFQQNRVHAVDLLIVIDNSCSMVEEQDNLATNFGALIQHFQDAEVDWRLAVTTTDTEVDRYRGRLMRGDDELILRGPSGELDRVAYDRDWDFTPGTSLQLGALDRSLNDDRGQWCDSTAAFGTDSFGTPGIRNADCDGRPPAPGFGTDVGPRPPVTDDLVISEIMAESAGPDSLCEWFEISVNTADTLDLSGVELFDEGRNHVVFPDGTLFPPWSAVVVGRSADTAENCGTPVDFAFAEGLSLNDDVAVIGPDTPDADELFSEAVAQGTIGAGIEMGLEAAKLVFEEPYYTDDNGAWLRDAANLSILFVSDEDDMSPEAAWSYVRAYTDLKGDQAYRDRRMVNLSAVVGKEVPPADGVPSCATDNGLGWYGARYLAVAAETEGLIASICEEDFAPLVRELGLTLSGLELEFALSGLPRLSTLEVALYDAADHEAKVADLVRDTDYTYVADGNLIRFEEDQLPSSEMWIAVEYEVLPDSVGTAQ